MVASLAIMFVALLPPVLFYVTHEAQVSVRLARTPLRTYLWTLVVGPTVVLVLMLLNVALWRERESLTVVGDTMQPAHASLWLRR